MYEQTSTKIYDIKIFGIKVAERIEEYTTIYEQDKPSEYEEHEPVDGRTVITKKLFGIPYYKEYGYTKPYSNVVELKSLKNSPWQDFVIGFKSGFNGSDPNNNKDLISRFWHNLGGVVICIMIFIAGFFAACFILN